MDSNIEEFVFHLREDIVKRPKINKMNPVKKIKQKGSSQVASAMETEDGEYYEISDDPEGGKHVSMGIIVPNEDDEEFDFCSYECSISDKEQIELIKSYMSRYEKAEESRPFLMIGRPLMGTDLDIFYSLDGEIIFNFIFDEKIKDWIKEAGFVLGKVISYRADSYSPDKLNVTLSVSKRKAGETLFKQASKESMDYIEEVVESTADYKVEGKIIDAMNDYLTGDMTSPYQVAVVPWNGLTVYTTLEGEQIGIVFDSEIQELAEKNKGVVGHIIDFAYDDDEINVQFTIRVSRSIHRLPLEQDSETYDNAVSKHDPSESNNHNKFSTPLSISEKVFSKFMSDNIGCNVFNAPNSSWKYDTTKFNEYKGKKYESYIFKKNIFGNSKCKEIQAVLVTGEGVRFCVDMKMNKKEIIDFVYKYKKLFFPYYTLAKCKKEYGDEEILIFTEEISPSLQILLPDTGTSCSIVFFTSFCNKDYIDKQKAKGEIITQQK